jgi:hypothetical protein
MRVKIAVYLEIESDTEANALAAVNRTLDDGDLQIALHEKFGDHVVDVCARVGHHGLPSRCDVCGATSRTLIGDDE